MSQHPDLGQLAKEFVYSALNSSIVELTPVSGGFISEAYKAKSDRGEVFFIKGQKSPSRSFEREAYGLELLGEYFLVPKVLATSEHFLVLEWIESGRPSKNSYELFGKSLAKMHKKAQSESGKPGFPFDNTIGATLQINENSVLEWPQFFWEKRLRAQLRWAMEAGFSFSKSELTALEKTCLKILSEINESCLSLIHGDLWGGNHKFTNEGTPWLFDPSCYYGHREADLAMMTLFSGFPEETFKAYDQEFPRETCWGEREPLYQLYHVLNHVNLFGGSYYSQAKSLITKII